MNLYLFIIGVLIILLSLKECKSNFSPLNLPEQNGPVGVTQNYGNEIQGVENFVEPYQLDTRYRYPYSPPVNSTVTKSVITTQVPGSPELFGESAENLLGDQKLIKIPLQYNSPYNEQLRTQEVLITPYNRIKYC
jgi:hypothetical protein